MEQETNKKGYSKWALLILLPIVWGLLGLIEGKGFFPYIVENLRALIIIGVGLLILLGLLTFLDRNK